MFFSNTFRRFLCFFALMVLPMNIRIITKSSTVVQEWVDQEPMVWGMASRNSSQNNETAVSSSSLSLDSIGSLLALGGGSSEASNTPTMKEEKEEHNNNNIPPRSGGSAVSIPSVEDPNSFAGCLQIMDDNHFLVEWLAYHYHVMPLRRLIVFPDPNSKTSPAHILHRWKDRINITIWDDELKYVYPKGYSKPRPPTIILRHRQRQRQFVRRCILALQKEGREWLFLTDTDEYITINDRVRNPRDPLSPVKYAPSKNVTLPSPALSGSVLQFIQNKDIMYPHTQQHLWNISCLTIARKVFGTKEQKNLQPLHGKFDPYHFQTLRWRKYGNVRKPGKSILNLKRLDDLGKHNSVMGSAPSIHRPLDDAVCQGKMWLPEELSVIVANHYPGTLEQMLFRTDDARGADDNVTAYRIKRFKDYQKHSNVKESDNVRQWLSGFIQSVGEPEAQRLLQHVGQPKEASGLDDNDESSVVAPKSKDETTGTEEAAEDTEEEDTTEDAEEEDAEQAEEDGTAEDTEEEDGTTEDAEEEGSGEAEEDGTTEEDTEEAGEESEAIANETEEDAPAEESGDLEIPESTISGDPSEVKQTAVATKTTTQPMTNHSSSTIVSKDDPESFGACLQIMDDNHFLIEYLAYHYHVMPLRRLIVLADPHSATSPAPILERWKDRIEITQWFEKDVFPYGIPPPPSKHKVQTRVGQHRTRQRTFVKKCMQTLFKEGREWIVLTDTDEYTYIGDRVRNPKDKLSPEKSIGKSLEIPTQREPGSILKFLRNPDYVIPLTQMNLVDNPCITMARKTFGTRTLKGASANPVAGYKNAQFQTFAWRYWLDEGKPGKTLVNLKKIRLKDIPHSPSVHRPFEKEGPICKGPIFMNEHKSPFVVNHYPGNLEQMLFRVHDSRGNHTNATEYRTERFKNLKKIKKNTESETILEWLPGFVETVGAQEAERLLKDVGDPHRAAGISPNDSSQQSRSVQGPGGEPASKQQAESASLSPGGAQGSNDAGPFSACLIINDDNLFLPEWLAFHAHTLPLRRLIILNEPGSRTSPKAILDRWSTTMEITLWDEVDIYPKGLPTRDNEDWLRKDRQQQFTKHCLRKLHREGRGWTTVTGVNEYTMINNRVRDPEDNLSPQQYIGNYAKIKLPTNEEPGSVSKLLGQEGMVIRHTGQPLIDNPCITMARKTFGTKPPPSPELVVAGFNASHFQTLCWRYFDDEGKPGKSMVDLRQINIDEVTKSASINRPITGDICKGSLRLSERQSLFVVNRYPHTLPHAGKLKTVELKDEILENDATTAWLSAFVASVGEEKARSLLETADPTAATA
ncbi:expressed unknown protein [Seminavis robusta]|uniref:Uncharacterized protein n=1 Tax=Seminavis robusta TaxID=568900 RepID=A0A9N8HHN3_9STRA|nr:expressed unknown protein [Seminavis robusta]|eukprot:Sro546_g164000.1 n/a (1313) ;mRNA; r:9298-13530